MRAFSKTAILNGSCGLLAVALSVAVATQARALSVGSGFFVNGDGYIVTNYHVVSTDIRTRDGRIITRLCDTHAIRLAGIISEVSYVGGDPVNDLAVLKLDTNALRRVRAELARRSGTVTRAGGARARLVQAQTPRQQKGWRNLGDVLADRDGKNPPGHPTGAQGSNGHGAAVSEGNRPTFLRFAPRAARAGQTANIFGFPLSLSVSKQLKVTQGVVVATVGMGEDTNHIQVDGAATHGGSGGPVLDERGNLIGVMVSIITELPNVPHVVGFNFAIKSSIVRNLMDSLRIPYELSHSTTTFDAEELYRQASNFVMLIVCQ